MDTHYLAGGGWPYEAICGHPFLSRDKAPIHGCPIFHWELWEFWEFWEFVDTHYLARGQFMDTHCLAGGICKLMGVQYYEFPPYACRYWRCPSEGPRFPKIAQGFKA